MCLKSVLDPKDDVFGESFNSNDDVVDDSDEEGEIKFIGVNDNVEAAQDQPTDLSIGQDLAIEPDSSKTEVLDHERIDLNYLIEAIPRTHKATSLTSEEIREKWRMGIDQNKLDYYKNMVIIFCHPFVSISFP